MPIDFLNKLIPVSLRGDYNLLMRSQLLVGLLLVSITLLALFTLSSLLFFNELLEMQFMVFSIGLVLIYCLIFITFMKTHNLQLSSHLFMASMSVSIFIAMQLSGGFSESVILQVVFLIPILAFLLMGLNKGVIWFVLSALMTSVSFVFSKLDIGSMQVLTVMQNEILNDFLHFLMFLMLSGAVMIYETINEDLKNRLYLEKVKLSHEASHDGLTQIPNRSEFLRRLNQAILIASQNNTQVVVIYIDLDDFKPVNDTYGHHAGDELLEVIAQRLQATIRSSDTAARLGGDEFAVILSGVELSQDVQPVIDNILNAIRKPIKIANNDVLVRASLGLASYPQDASNADQLCISADTAMYKAKALHDGCVHYKDIK